MDLTSQYFASLKKDEIAEYLLDKVEKYDQYLDSTGLRSLWRRCSDTYYRGVTKSFLEEVGENAEFLSVFIGHFRNILQHVATTATAERPGFEPEATNVDYISRAQIQSCSGMLDYYFDDKKYESVINRQTENAILFGEQFVEQTWDAYSGPMIDVEQVPFGMDTPEARGALESGTSIPTFNKPVYPGDVTLRLFGPLDVIRDVTKESFSDQQWLILRKPRNRWDLIARYPEFKQDILDLPSRGSEKRYDQRLSPLRLHVDETDDVDTYVFYHITTPAMPFGRVIEFLENEVVLDDKTLDEAGHKHFPVYREAAGDIEGAPFGYTTAFDLLALVDLVNLLYSTVATNQATFGVQSIQAMNGSSIKATSIAKGLTLFEYASIGGKLEPLQLTSTPAEIFKFIEMVERLMETLSGVNAVARGNAPPSLESGAALALVQAQHIEFTKGLQLSRYEVIREVCTGLVELFKANAHSPRLAAIAGKAGRTYLKELSAPDIAKISRVTVTPANPLARSPAGRRDLAQQLGQAGVVLTPEQYMSVITTGKIEPVVHGRQAQLDLIQAENEELMEGNNPSVALTDDHVLHILEHSPVGADIVNRKNNQVMTAYAEHIMGHLNELMQMPPNLAQILKQPAPAVPPMDPNAGGQPPSPPQNGAPLPPGGEPASGAAAGGEVPFPKNPLTGQQWEPASAGQ